MKEDDISKIVEGITSLEKLSGGNLSHWRYVLENANTIWDKCPFKVGDLVRLNKTPEITKDKSWGWLGSKHFLIEGALGRIETREFYKGKFIFGVTFPKETWIDSSGKENLPDRLSIYYFGENWLNSANYDMLTCEAL